MADVVMGDVPEGPEGIVASIDADARRLRLSRSEYRRRMVQRCASGPRESVTVRDLEQFAQTFADLADPEVMNQAWRSSWG